MFRHQDGEQPGDALRFAVGGGLVQRVDHHRLVVAVGQRGRDVVAVAGVDPDGLGDHADELGGGLAAGVERDVDHPRVGHRPRRGGGQLLLDDQVMAVASEEVQAVRAERRAAQSRAS